jgi:uncharacterized protein (TIGR02145 family)
MKILLILITFISLFANAQSVGVGTLNPSASAILDVTSANKGFLPPRMTLLQRNAITSPVAGLQIWNIDCKELQVFNGTIWTNMIGGTACLSLTNSQEVTICNQIWMTKNLNVSTYRNGDIIPNVTDPTTWANLTTGAWCWYLHDSANYSFYGKLYNWYAVNDPRGLAPLGWHIPNNAEWVVLSNCLGGDAVAAGAMKEATATYWSTPNIGATNSSGFTGIPSGACSNGAFEQLHSYGYFWSSTQSGSYGAWFRFLYFGSSTLGIFDGTKALGLSVRCLRD